MQLQWYALRNTSYGMVNNISIFLKAKQINLTCGDWMGMCGAGARRIKIVIGQRL